MRLIFIFDKIKMLSFLLVLLSVASICLAEPSPDQELINKVLKFTTECASKANIKYDVCLEMFKEGMDLTDAKYDGCKCLVPCVSKKLNIMSDDGKFDPPAIEGYMNNLKTPAWKEEAQRVYPLCKSKLTEKTECEAGFIAFQCAMENSEKGRNLAMKFVKILSGKA